VGQLQTGRDLVNCGVSNQNTLVLLGSCGVGSTIANACLDSGPEVGPVRRVIAAPVPYNTSARIVRLAGGALAIGPTRAWRDAIVGRGGRVLLQNICDIVVLRRCGSAIAVTKGSRDAVFSCPSAGTWTQRGSKSGGN